MIKDKYLRDFPTLLLALVAIITALGVKEFIFTFYNLPPLFYHTILIGFTRGYFGYLIFF